MRTTQVVVGASLLIALVAAAPLAAADPMREPTGYTFVECADVGQAAACVSAITTWCTLETNGYDNAVACLVDHAGTSAASNPTRIDPARTFVQCSTAPEGEERHECAIAIVTYCTSDEHGYDTAAACLLDHIGVS